MKGAELFAAGEPDLGDGAACRERWLVANLVCPLACASFACSPAPGAVSARALTWQALDPSRTGFPRRLVDGFTDDPVEQLADAALDADVLLVRRDPPPWEPGRPGLRSRPGASRRCGTARRARWSPRRRPRLPSLR